MMLVLKIREKHTISLLLAGQVTGSHPLSDSALAKILHINSLPNLRYLDLI